jgi:hypothetical protein
MKDRGKIIEPFVFDPGIKREGVSKIAWLSETSGQCMLAFTYHSRSGGEK